MPTQPLEPAREPRAFSDDASRVRIRTVVDHQTHWVAEDLVGDEVVVERVPIGREVTAAPDVRREGDLLIVPVVEEVLVVEKRLVLKEELHVRKVSRRVHVEEPVLVSHARAVVERSGEVDERSFWNGASEAGEVHSFAPRSSAGGA